MASPAHPRRPSFAKWTSGCSRSSASSNTHPGGSPILRRVSGGGGASESAGSGCCFPGSCPAAALAPLAWNAAPGRAGPCAHPACRCTARSAAVGSRPVPRPTLVVHGVRLPRGRPWAEREALWPAQAGASGLSVSPAAALLGRPVLHPQSAAEASHGGAGQGVIPPAPRHHGGSRALRGTPCHVHPPTQQELDTGSPSHTPPMGRGLGGQRAPPRPGPHLHHQHVLVLRLPDCSSSQASGDQLRQAAEEDSLPATSSGLRALGLRAGCRGRAPLPVPPPPPPQAALVRDGLVPDPSEWQHRPPLHPRRPPQPQREGPHCGQGKGAQAPLGSQGL